MSQPNASLARSPALAVLAGLLCAQGACSLRSLDYLKSGQPHDSAVVDSRDADIERYPRTDVSGVDVVSLDSQGGARELGGTGGIDGMRGDNWDGDEPDVGALPEVEADLGAEDDVTGAEDAGSNETADASAGGDDGEGDTVDVLPGFDPDLGTGGVPGTGGTGGSGGNTGSGGNGGGDARGGAGGGTAGDAGAADTNNACAGLGVGGICWYLGSQGLSCQQFCASHGGPAPAAVTYVGSTHQGGGILKCAILLGLLGVSGTPQTATRTDGSGFGCYLFVPDGSTYWLSSPDFSVTASGATARLVCGCTQ